MRPRRLAAALLAVAVAGACGDIEDHPTLSIDATGTVRGILFLDTNGNGVADTQDERVEDWPVRLLTPAGAVAREERTDTAGVFRFEDVPVGEFSLQVDTATLADTLEAFGVALSDTIRLGRGDTVTVTPGFTYPKVDLTAVDTVPPGLRIFTTGIALNALTSVGPRELHLRSGAEALRVVNVQLAQVNRGDSVRVLGRTRLEAGQIILSDATTTVLRVGAQSPQPRALTTGRASMADGGQFGADLVRVRDADLLESENVESDVLLTVDDGTGELEILVRSFLGTDASFFDPDSVEVREATGLLIPVLGVGDSLYWRLAPRDGSDLRFRAVEQDTSTAQPGTSTSAAGIAPAPSGVTDPTGAEAAQAPPGASPGPQVVARTPQIRGPARRPPRRR